MEENLTPVEKLAYSTVRIEADLVDGGVSTGTGFFFRLKEKQDESHIPVIVTNKHVVADTVRGRFRLTLKDESGSPLVKSHFAFELDHFQKRWVPHPDGNTYAGPQHTATGEIEIVNVPVKLQPVAISRIPSNLGIVIKSKKLLDFDNNFT